MWPSSCRVGDPPRSQLANRRHGRPPTKNAAAAMIKRAERGLRTQTCAFNDMQTMADRLLGEAEVLALGRLDEVARLGWTALT